MASGPETDVKILATGLAAGILLDATVIRALLVPAVVSLFGRWNWWLPAGPGAAAARAALAGAGGRAGPGVTELLPVERVHRPTCPPRRRTPRAGGSGR